MGQSSSFSTAAVFVRVVELGSLRAAARALEMPKSNVSRRLAELEAQLGVRLLERTTRQLRPTEAGSEYYRHARTAVLSLQEAERAARDLQQAPRGLLRITAPTNFGVQFLPELTAEFLTRYPELEVTLELSDRHVELVEENFDVALRAGPLSDSSMIAVKLGGTVLATVASPAYLASRGTPLEPTALTAHSCLVRGTSPDVLWRFRSGRTSIDVAVHGRLCCNNYLILRSAALAGLGIARLPSLLAQEALKTRALVPVLEAFEPPEAPLHLLYPSSRNLSPKVRAFVEFIKEAFSRPPLREA